MVSSHWSDVWTAFGANFAREQPLVQIAIILGIALVVVLALEGVHASLFPARYLRHRFIQEPVDSAPVD